MKKSFSDLVSLDLFMAGSLSVLFGTSFALALPKLLFMPAISSTLFESLPNMLLLQADILQRHLNFPILLEVYLRKYLLCIEYIVLWQVLILRSIPV